MGAERVLPSILRCHVPCTTRRTRLLLLLLVHQCQYINRLEFMATYGFPGFTAILRHAAFSALLLLLPLLVLILFSHSFHCTLESASLILSFFSLVCKQVQEPCLARNYMRYWCVRVDSWTESLGRKKITIFKKIRDEGKE